MVFQLVRVYHVLGEDAKAAQALAVARDMAPKSLNKIKRLVNGERGVDEEGELDVSGASGAGGAEDESMQEG